MTAAAGGAARPVRDLFRIGEFRSMWASFALSAAGDRLALIALTFVVYDRTRSPFLAAVAYASGTVPYLLGALLFGGLADWLPRRAVMVGADLVRAAVTAVMVVPGVPLAALVGLLYVVTAAQQPFDAARAAVIRDIVDGPRYVAGVTVMQVTYRLMFVAGAAAGGLAVALIGPRPAIAADSATFVISALLLRTGIRARPAAACPGDAPAGCGTGAGGTFSGRWAGGTAGAVRLVFGDPVLRVVVGFGWLAALYEVPEGIAAPYAAADGGGALAAGLLLASGQAMVLAAPWYSRLPEAARRRWMGPLAVAATGVLTLTALHPGIAASMVIFAVAGAAGSYQVTANTAFVLSAPPARRGQALSVAAAGLVACQGLAFTAAGWAAQAIPPAAVTAIAGGAGAVIACCLSVSWRRGAAAERARPGTAQRPG